MAAARRHKEGFLPLKTNMDGRILDVKRRKRVNKNKKKNWNKVNDSLFFVDTGETDEKDTQPQTTVKKGKNLKPLWIDLILQLDSHIPAPKNVLAFQQPNDKKQQRISEKATKLAAMGVLPRRENLLQLRRAGVSVKEHPVANNNPDRACYDLWSAGSEQLRPERLNEKPLFLPAIEVITPGGSYNPDFFSHQDLLREAHEVEVKKLKAEEKLARQLAVNEDIAPEVQPLTICYHFQAKQLLQQISCQLSSQSKGMFNCACVELLLSCSYDICNNVCFFVMQPEGSILKDRFKSLQKRNIIEARERAKFKRKYKLEYSEKRAFREIQ
uniref:Ribosome biogenesis protein NOP53 n=1 Tax=Sinocyclocheilus grahami TaxID=75366 RepID=A0A672L0U6_SINGR